MISVQLLASCFTPPQDMNTLTLPSCWYPKENQTDDNWLSTTLVSSLRQHTQWKYSPAFGHQARNNSTASLSEKDDALSREALLAEPVSLNRRLRQKEDGATKESIDMKRCRRSEMSGDEPKYRRLLSARFGTRLRKSEKSASSQRVPQEPFSYGPGTSNPRGMVEQNNVLKVIRDLRVRKLNNDVHRRSLEPVLRSEDHPVFVQPVKDYVMRRCRVFRSRGHRQSSMSASSQGITNCHLYQRAASSASEDSMQLGRRNRIMAMNQGSGTSTGQPTFDAETLWSPRVDIEGTVASAEVPHDFADNAQRKAGSEPPIVIERSEGALTMESSAAYLPPTERVPCYSLPSSESGHTRDRTSTSGTTVYNPPLIAEASPNSKRLESDGSTSSGTSSSIEDPKFLHEEERGSTSE